MPQGREMYSAVVQIEYVMQQKNNRGTNKCHVTVRMLHNNSETPRDDSEGNDMIKHKHKQIEEMQNHPKMTRLQQDDPIRWHRTWTN